MTLLKKIEKYIPSNIEEIKFFLSSEFVWKEHDLIYNGYSSYKFKGRIYKTYPLIFGEIKKFIEKCFDGRYEIVDMWVNVYPKESFVKPHSHYSSYFPNSISGCYYIQLPKKSGDFYLENVKIHLNENDLIFFRDDQVHWTTQNLSNNLKVVISFNMTPTLSFPVY